MPERKLDLRIAGVLFLLTLGVYAFTLRGYLSFDEETMYCVTESMWERNEVRIVDSLLADTNSYTGRDGNLYSWYDLGQSIYALPLYGFGRVASMFVDEAQRPFVTRFAVNHMGALFGALSIALFYLIARSLGAGVRRAAILALIVALATPFWFYSRTFYRESVNGFLFLAMAAMLFEARRAPARWKWTLAGTAAGLAVLLRVTNLLICLPIVIYVIHASWPVRDKWREVAQRLRWTGTPIACALALACFYSWWRFEQWLPASPPDSRGFATPFLVGLWGELFSPGRGLLVFAPMLFALPMFAAAFLRRRSKQPEGVFILATCSVIALVFAKWIDWHGGSCWGPRYLVPLIPLLFLFFVRPLRPALRPDWDLRARTAVFAAAVLFSVAVQVSGILLEGKNVRAHEGEVAFNEIIFNPYHSTAVRWDEWNAVADLSLARVPVELEAKKAGGGAFREVLETSPGVWSALLYRMGLSKVFLLPALLELVLAGAAAMMLLRLLRKSQPSALLETELQPAVRVSRTETRAARRPQVIETR